MNQLNTNKLHNFLSQTVFDIAVSILPIVFLCKDMLNFVG
jgi:hypothetical protein